MRDGGRRRRNGGGGVHAYALGVTLLWLALATGGVESARHRHRLLQKTTVTLGTAAAAATDGDDNSFVCVFLHGIGTAGPPKPLLRDVPFANRSTHPQFAQRNFASYWGDMRERVLNGGGTTAAGAGGGARCSRAVFYVTDTLTRGWNDTSLQSEYCSVLRDHAAHVVFAHSMANLVLAGGVANGVAGCADRLVRDTGDAASGTNGGGAGGGGVTHWYGLQGPLRGTIAADLLHELCPNPIVARLVKGCRRAPKPGRKPKKAAVGGDSGKKKKDPKWTISDAYASLQPSAIPKSVADTAARLMSGNMCGVLAANGHAQFQTLASRAPGAAEKGSFWSTLEKGAIDVALSVVSAAVGGLEHASQYADSLHRDFDTKTIRHTPASDDGVPAYANDGLVGFASCRGATPRANYRRSPASPFYALDGNHSDGRCRFGEDPSVAAAQPCSWMLAMLARSAKSFGYVPRPSSPRVTSASSLPPPLSSSSTTKKHRLKPKAKPTTHKTKTIHIEAGSLQEAIESFVGALTDS